MRTAQAWAAGLVEERPAADPVVSVVAPARSRRSWWSYLRALLSMSARLVTALHVPGYAEVATDVAHWWAGIRATQVPVDARWARGVLLSVAAVQMVVVVAARTVSWVFERISRVVVIGLLVLPWMFR